MAGGTAPPSKPASAQPELPQRLKLHSRTPEACMGLLSQVGYPGAVLVNVDTGQPKPLRILFGAPPEVSRRLKADQQPGPDGKPVNNFPDVVVCPGVRVVQDTPTLCPE